MQFVETFWALIPPVVAIGLALITKEVYISLFVGILAGALFYTGFQPIPALETIFSIIAEKIGENSNIIIFLTLLGMLVCLLEKSGASSAYGDWASKKISTKRGVLAATSALGALIMVDDYFICLTAGTVMSPVADKKGISRTKLAYIVCSTAAPICILVPISSWATAVTTSLPKGSTINGFKMFLQTIPFNFFALLTLFMLVYLVIANFDFGAMKKFEDNHEENTAKSAQEENEIKSDKKGKISDLILPLVGLIIFCVAALLYTGGFFKGGVSIAKAFNDCNSSLALAIGSFLTIVLTGIWYLPRKTVKFMEFAEAFSEGFKSMAPAILILTFAWTLEGICNGCLGLGGYVSKVVAQNANLLNLMPALFFLVATGLAFATGTSWGTFTILIPIAVTIFGEVCPLMVITVAAILGGSVCGDITSPISDTTVIVSAGTGCSYMDHVSTQIPYSFLVAGVSFVGYVVSGLTENGWYGLIASTVLLTAILTALAIKNKKANA